MVRICPRCRATVERSFLCPACGGQTIDANPAAQPNSAAAATLGPIERATFGGGTMVGLLVAQGLYYAARNLTIAYLLATAGAAAEAAFWHDSGGQAAEQALQVVALIAGGMIAGAGHRQSVAAGAALGVANSVLLSAMLVLLRRPPSETVLYGQPILHAVIGAVAGFVGQGIWQPAPDLAPLPRVSRKGAEVLSIVLPEHVDLPEIEPLPWGRILLGTVIGVAGTMWARTVLALVLTDTSAQELVQSQYVTWALTILAQALGGAIAGVNTRNGFQYGFWVGMLTGATIMVLLSAAEMRLPTNEALASVFGLSLPEGSPAAAMFQAGQALVLGVAGGWLGGLILPRMARKRRIAGGAA
jgi:hypothetical protein